MYSYKVINFKSRYKPLEEYSSSESDEDTTIEDPDYQEANRIFEKVDEKFFIQMKLEFNSYLLPCNGGIYLSRYSSFDNDKLTRFFRYILAKSNYNINEKITNYYQFFICLHLLLLKEKDKVYLDEDKIAEKKKEKKKKNEKKKKAEYKDPQIQRLNVDKFMKEINNNKVKLIFNLIEMLSYHYYILNNFFVSEKIKSSVKVMEQMIIQLNDFVPLYRIYDINEYIYDRKKYINNYINNECVYFSKNYMRTNLSAPGKYTGELKHEKFIIGRKMFYDFNRLIFDEDSEVVNKSYKDLLEKLRSCLTNYKYGFIISHYYTNKFGKKTPVCMVREYSFTIKNNIAKYTVEELLKWFLNFYNYYNNFDYRYINMRIINHNICCTDVTKSLNPFRQYLKFKGQIITNKKTVNGLYQKINQEEILSTYSRTFDPYYKEIKTKISEKEVDKNIYEKYDDKIFNLNKFDYNKIYINNNLFTLYERSLYKKNNTINLTTKNNKIITDEDEAFIDIESNENNKNEIISNNTGINNKNKKDINDTNNNSNINNYININNISNNNNAKTYVNIAIFNDVFSKFYIKRNLNPERNIIYRPVYFHIIAPTAKFLYRVFKCKRFEISQSNIIDIGFMGNDNLYNERIALWKKPGYLKIKGFSLIISGEIINPYLYNIHENIQSPILIPEISLIMFIGTNSHIFHYLKKFHRRVYFEDNFLPNNAIIKLSDRQNFFDKYNELFFSYLQLNTEEEKPELLYQILTDIKIPKLYPVDFYKYIHNLNNENQLYQLDSEYIYQYQMFKRVSKYYSSNINYTENDQIYGNKIHTFLYNKLIYEISRLNLLLFSGIKFPMANDIFIPNNSYDLFLIQNSVDNFEKIINIEKLKTPMNELIYNDNKTKYDKLFDNLKDVYDFYTKYTNNKIEKIKFYSNIDDYYNSNKTYNNNIYNLIYNCYPDNIKSFMRFYYEIYNKRKINSLSELNYKLYNMTEKEKKIVFGEYYSYVLINNYLKVNYKISMYKQYEKYFDEFDIDLNDMDKPLILFNNDKQIVFNKPNKPKSDFVFYLEDKFNYNKSYNNDLMIFAQFEKLIKEFISNDNIKKEYKEKEEKEFIEFRTRLLYWETNGFYEI